MKLVIMTKPTFFVEEDKIITALFEEGMTNLHVNKPESSPLYCERLLSLLSDSYYNKITVHGHYYLKNEYGLEKIHIDAPTGCVPEGYKGKVSRTCTSTEQLKEAKRHSEYVFLESSRYTTTELEAAAEKGLIGKHVYAMGGITIDNIKTFKDIGFGGIVVCSDLWNKFDIHHDTDFKRLINHFGKIKKMFS